MLANRSYAETVAGPLARLVRTALTILGGSAFGLGAGSLTIHSLLTLATGNVRQQAGGTAPAWLFIMLIGGVIGMIAGLALAMHHVRNAEMRALVSDDWLGMLGGLLLAALLYLFVSDRQHWLMKVLYLSVIVPSCVAGGRLLVRRIMRGRLGWRRP